MIFSRSLFILFCFFFLTTTNSATAGYSPETRSIKDGGGTWGSILEMSADVRGSSILFTIRKQDGLSFNTESNISIRTGSYNGPSVAADIVPLGSSVVSLKVRPDSRSPEQSYYAYLFNSYGHAWVGPLKIDEYVNRDVEVPAADSWLNSSSSSTGLERPRLGSPSTAFVGEQLRIAVTTGSCSGSVQMQCFAEDADQRRSNYYESGQIWSAKTIQVPFSFDRPGTKTIFCKTRSNCCSSAWASQTIRVEERPNRAPSPPQISSSPTEVGVNVPVYIPVLSGLDPDGDQVKVKCWTEDAIRKTYVSGWLNHQQSVDAVFTFGSSGIKPVACVTVDRKRTESLSTERPITVRDERSDRSSRSETKINISVVTGADGTADSKVSVQSSRTEDCAPFCNGNGEITYDKPYLPEDITPADGQPVYEPDDNRYIFHESVPDGRP